MAEYILSEAGDRRLLADLERVPVWHLKRCLYFGWVIRTEAGTTLTQGRTQHDAATEAVRLAESIALPEPVLILPDDTHIAASDFLAQTA